MEVTLIATLLGAVISAVAAIISVFVAHYLGKNTKGVIGSIAVMVICIVVICIIGINIFFGNNTKNNGENGGNSGSDVIKETESPTDTGGGSSEETPEPETPKRTKTVMEKSLFDLEPYTYEPSSEYTPFSDDYNVKDIFGTEYATAYRAYMDRDDGKYSMTYRLDGKYTKMAAIVAVAERSKGSKYKGTIYIYTDGKKVVDYPSISSKFESKKIKVNLKGVRDLKIEMYGAGNMGITGIHVLLAEPTLYYLE